MSMTLYCSAQMWQRSWPGKHRLNAFSVNVSHSHCIHVKPSFSVASRGRFSRGHCASWHRLSRQRTVRALRRRISWFNQLLGSPSHLPPPSLVTGTVGWLTTPCCLTVRPAWLYCSAYWRHSIAIMVSSVMPTPGNYANTCIIMNLENCAAFYPMALAIITCVSARPGFPSHISKPHSKASLGLGGLYKQ